jgi:hypothetical protein
MKLINQSIQNTHMKVEYISRFPRKANISVVAETSYIINKHSLMSDIETKAQTNN